ncbi:MAG: hypothetical protein J2P36_38435 [Ktedonobacteraceae bacterium]|nr:hypothetical protein [Ktedonobacteraceae bacterium]
MAIVERSTIVGVFTDSARARMALEELQRAGFTAQQVSFISGRTGEQSTLSRLIGPVATTRATAGVIGGGVVGGIAGAVAALLIPGFGPALSGGMFGTMLGGTVLGALAGGFVSTLVSMGIPEDDARYYQAELEKGRSIVMVRAGERTSEANAILRQSGAYAANGSLAPLIEPGGPVKNEGLLPAFNIPAFNTLTKTEKTRQQEETLPSESGTAQSSDPVGDEASAAQAEANHRQQEVKPHAEHPEPVPTEDQPIVANEEPSNVPDENEAAAEQEPAVTHSRPEADEDTDKKPPVSDDVQV